MASAQPVPPERLEQITVNACEKALSSADSYVHAQTESWNTTIINTILENLVSAASNSSEASDSASPSPQYKYAVNSTIIQHLSSPTLPPSAATQTVSPPDTPAPAQALGANEADARDVDIPIRGGASDERSSGTTAGEGEATKPTKGRRGMHSATGAYWNNETDGMWSYKYEGSETKGLDVVVSVIWVAVA